VAVAERGGYEEGTNVGTAAGDDRLVNGSSVQPMRFRRSGANRFSRRDIFTDAFRANDLNGVLRTELSSGLKDVSGAVAMRYEPRR
jgi:hypothetical protein